MGFSSDEWLVRAAMPQPYQGPGWLVSEAGWKRVAGLNRSGTRPGAEANCAFVGGRSVIRQTAIVHVCARNALGNSYILDRAWRRHENGKKKTPGGMDMPARGLMLPFLWQQTMIFRRLPGLFV